MTDGSTPGALLDYAQDVIALLDETGTVTYVNAAVGPVLGYSREEFVGRDAFGLIHPEDRPVVWEAFAATIESEGYAEESATYRIRDADGEWVWLESRTSNLTDSEIDGYVVSSRDVTDRVAAEREQREVATRLEELAAVSRDVLWLFSSDWSELLFVNSAYEDVFGRPRSELESDPTTFLEAIHPDDRAVAEDAMARLSAGEPVEVEYRVNPEEDYGVRVWVYGQPIREDGEVARIAGFTRDVTERHRRERQLYVMDNLLRHNLRNDLNVVLGAADAVGREAPEVADQADLIRRTAEDLLRTAEKEREIIDVLVGDTERTRVDLVEAVDRSVTAVRERFPGATVSLSCPEAAPARAVGRVQLVVSELLENAVRHSDADGRSDADGPAVSVAVRETGDTVELVVDDECPPIPDNEAAVLTGDHDMTDVYHSTGLGLWLVYWGVELSGGDVGVEAREDGNRVRVELPAVSD